MINEIYTIKIKVSTNHYNIILNSKLHKITLLKSEHLQVVYNTKKYHCVQTGHHSSNLITWLISETTLLI